MEPCCWLTYTRHRDTQATLSVLDTLDSELQKKTEEELARMFGYEEEYHGGKLTLWMKIKPMVWMMFDEPKSSIYAKVIARFESQISLYNLTVLRWLA